MKITLVALLTLAASAIAAPTPGTECFVKRADGLLERDPYAQPLSILVYPLTLPLFSSGKDVDTKIRGSPRENALSNETLIGFEIQKPKAAATSVRPRLIPMSNASSSVLMAYTNGK